MLFLLSSAALAGPPIEIPRVEIAVPGGRVEPFLSTQLRLSSNRADDWEPRLGFRRIRAGWKAAFAEERLFTSFQVNLVPGKAELIDLYGGYRAGDWDVRLGQFTIPFTWYRQQSHRETVLVDWSIFTQYFGAERQIGAQVTTPSDALVRGAFGIFTGVNARASHAVMLAKVQGIEPRNRSSFATGRGDEHPVHPELVGRVGIGREGIEKLSVGEAPRRQPKGALFLSGAADLRPTRTDLALRIAPEGVLQVGRVGLYGGLFASWFERDGLQPAFLGALSEAAWRFQPQWELAGRIGHVTLAEPLEEVAIPGDLSSPGTELLGGLTWYVAGEQLELSADFGGLHVGDFVPRARLQAQLAW